MRKAAGLLLAAATLLTAGIAPSPAGAAAGTTCKTLTGTATLSPGLPKFSSTTKVKTALKATGALSGCAGGAVKGGTLSASLKFGVATNCASLVEDGNTTAKGTARIKWGGARTSTLAMTASAKAPFSQIVLSGTVTAGQFVGSKEKVAVSFRIPVGACVTKPLTTATFKGATPFVI